MLVSDFNYDLPEERIAKFPPKERGTTRLLVLDRKTGDIKDSYYKDLADFLNPGDALILNDTRVMQSRLFCHLPDGRKRELVVLEKHGDEPQRVMYRGKLHDGDRLIIENNDIIVKKILGNGIAEVESDTPLAELTEKYGTVPLPPYLHRDATDDDKKRYQTVWAKNMGSAAAPTASLNMTEDLLNRLQQKGVTVKYLTLHVGLGTFLPMRTDNVEDHKMHSEWFYIPEDTIKAIKKANCVVALGTTVARTLEYYAKTGKTSGEDDIFIYPGFEFKIVDALLTNFHAPKSTVLMLASAFAGWDHLKNAYDHAISEKYNFLSYGDSMFIC
ncbi:tRNA preQ1(34) S-adenosylmethionine ribosyltransferase-isomerase QueA [Candidatus Saccharibacteria bacterium]|nr:tRNA preQ1(34) S-adenosylmethionine ribosyltransferase-isomerase QueA [Candidatus Saccharibacteria bacterium]MBR3253493.1 tRNA preQ1(34) S-adenosylmethionine ribosyltransferase-isomerase QueA [Candidatus Saccharibacteria bacterium]